MATREASLLAECVAHPDDDAPRLIWADAVGGERGELVMVQCGSGERIWRAQRERELLRQGLAWSGLDGLVQRVKYERGFVTAIEVDAETFVERGDEIVERAPLVRSLTLASAPDRAWTLRQIVEHPAFARITELDLIAERDESWPDGAMRELAAVIPRLRGLGVRRGLTALGVTALCNARPHKLERLWLRDGIVRGELRDLAVHAPELRELELVANQIDFYGIVMPNLATLILRNAHPGTLVALATSGLAHQITHLVVDPATGNHEFDATTLEALGQFSRLQTLELRGTVLAGREALLAFAKINLPALRQLALAGWTHSQDALAEVITKFSPQIDRLDLRQANRFDHGSDRILVDEPLEATLLGVPGDVPLVDPPGPPVPPAWLVCENGPQPGRVWDIGWLGARKIRIGRGSFDVVVHSGSVARFHAELQWRDGAFCVRDIVSTNGTRLDGVLVDLGRLRDGSELVLGTVGLRFFTGDGAGARATNCALRVATHEPLSGFPRSARAEAAWLRISNIAELEAHYGQVAGDAVVREVARRLRAHDAELSSPQRNVFRVFPAESAPVLAAACDQPVDHEGLMLEIRIETRPFG